MGEEERKQDCETKAFQRLAQKLKKAFPRLPVILLADSLYASEPVMETCRGNGWEYIIRYKTGSIPSITEEYENIPEKGKTGHAEFVNDIDYNGKKVNMLRFWEEKVEKGETVRTGIPVADKYKADRGECGESGAGGKEALEDRE